MNRKQHRAERKLKALPSERKLVSPFDINLRPDSTIAVGLKEREGVFIHAFKCGRCSLEFHIFSWRANRHHVGQVYCPECGKPTPMAHWRACVHEGTDFMSGGLEIFHLFRPVPMAMMDDTVLAA